MSEFNRELFQKIHDQITQNPETHDQNSWESFCGTTRCVAGWAVHFSNGEGRLWGAAFGDVTSETGSLIREVLGLQRPDYVGGQHVEPSARKLLGLTQRQAGGLFYGASDEEAVHLVALGAAGDNEAFDKYLREIEA